jgi:hypothetical protein
VTDGQTDDGEVIPICRHYSIEATQRAKIASESAVCVHLFKIFDITPPNLAMDSSKFKTGQVHYNNLAE